MTKETKKRKATKAMKQFARDARLFLKLAEGLEDSQDIRFMINWAEQISTHVDQVCE
jgi:hypothetical protein